MDAHLSTGDELGVLPAHQRKRFAVGQPQVLPRHNAESGLGGDGAAVRQLAVVRRHRFIGHLGARGVDAFAAEHARGRRQQRLQRRRLVKELQAIAVSPSPV